MTIFRKLSIPVVILGALVFSGCTYLDREFAASVKQSTDLIIPDYKAYVLSDPTLDESSKKARVDNADELDKLVNEAVQGE